MPKPSALLSLSAAAIVAGCVPAVSPVAGGTSGAAAEIERVVNRELTKVQEGGAPVVRVSGREGDGLAVVKGVRFAEGVIELDVKGEDLQGGSFVGVAFNVQNDSTYEAIYLRPFNFRAPDPVRRKRSVQYISHPAHPWSRLREESPERYEAAVLPVPDPNGWVRLRVEVTGSQVRVHAGEGADPDLVVERIGRPGTGPLAFWVGNASGGEFRKLVVRGSGTASSR